MHELSLAQGLLELACKSAAENKMSKISAIGVVAGELMGIVPDSLKFGFYALNMDSIAKDAVLEYREIPALIKCEGCQHQFPWKRHGYVCPLCQHSEGEMIQGEDFFIEYIEGDVEGEE